MKKIALMVGGTDGIGLEMARQMVKDDWELMLVGSNSQKGKKAIDIVGGNAKFIQADLTLISDTKKMAKEVLNQIDHLDVVYLGANRFYPKLVHTSEGFEAGFAVYYLSRFVLINELDSILSKTSGSRVVNLAGPGFDNGEIRWDDPSWKNGGFKFFPGLMQSRLANDLWFQALGEKWKDKNISLLSQYPGGVKTDMAKNLPFPYSIFFGLMGMFAASPKKGASFPLKLAIDSEYGMSGLRFFKINKPQVLTGRNADKNAVKRIWNWTIDLINI